MSNRVVELVCLFGGGFIVGGVLVAVFIALQKLGMEFL
jgi:hypothetical protein